MIEILFTASNTPVGRVIRYLTKEPMSHVAIKADDFVVHSAITGIEIVTYEYFKTKHNILASVTVTSSYNKLLKLVTEHQHSFYDYWCLVYLGIRYCAKRVFNLSLPKVNLWAVSGLYTCTEWVTKYLCGEEDSLITPYQLYKRLTESK